MIWELCYVNHTKKSLHRSTPKNLNNILFLWVLFLFFWCGPFFKVFVTALLLFYVLIFWPWGIPASQPGIKPTRTALEGEVLTTEPPGKSQQRLFLRKMKTDSLFPITCFFLNWHVLPFWFYKNICRCCLAAKLCLTLCNPMDCNLPGSSVCGISQSVLEWVSISFSRGSFWPRNWTHVSCIEGNSLPFEPPGKPIKVYTPK